MLTVEQNFMEDGPLHSIHWFRIVLDEAHTIKAFRNNTAKAVFMLTADRRWCLTGTPIQVVLGLCVGRLPCFIRDTAFSY